MRSPNFAASASAALRMGDRAQLAGEADLAEAGERSGRSSAHAAGRARDRQRDREVGPGLVDPHAADDVHEHVGGADRDARVAAEHGEHEREAVAIEPVARPAAAARAPTATTSAWTSTSSGREPSIAASTTLPGALVASPTNRARGVERPRRGRSSRISNTPTSFVEPKRFFSARSVR